MSSLKIKGSEKVLLSEVSEEIWNQISQLRNDYISCLKLAKETDSKKEEAYLKKEATDSLNKLRKVCPHQHTVCFRSEYDGSYLMDFNDSHQEHRVCLCCGIEEYAWNPDWKVLKIKPFSRFERDQPEQIKNPLSYLLSDVTEIAESKGYNYFGWSK
jgi:hypothetical protein